jgi:hypothetical protein
LKRPHPLTHPSPVPHGGFVTSVFLRVAELHFKSTLSSQNQPHAIALHLDFLRRTQSGSALFTVEDKKLGRQASVIYVTLSQDSREEVVGTITHSHMDSESGVSFSTGYALDPTPLPADLSRLVRDDDENWAQEASLPFAGFRKASEKTTFYFPRRGQTVMRMADEWVRLRNGERWTRASLGYVADMFPMPVEAFITRENAAAAGDLEGDGGKKSIAKFWYPTVLLNMDIKKPLPDEGVEWLFSRVAVKQIKNGRMDIEVVTMDAEGDIVMLSHHVSLAVSSARNMAGRKTGVKI